MCLTRNEEILACSEHADFVFLRTDRDDGEIISARVLHKTQLSVCDDTGANRYILLCIFHVFYEK